MKLPEGVDLVSKCPIMAGGFAEVWMGSYDSRDVAIKDLKVYEDDHGDDNVKVKKVSVGKETLTRSDFSCSNLPRRCLFGSDSIILTYYRSWELQVLLGYLYACYALDAEYGDLKGFGSF